MERLIATFFLILGVMQAEVMFAGALTISMQTNWPRLGHYVHQQYVEWKKGDQAKEDAAPKAKKAKKNRHINLSTQADQETQ